MRIVWGLVVTVLALLAWGGQTLTWFDRPLAERLGLTERRDDVDPVYLADIDGEAAWDALSLWPMAVAGVLLAAGVSWWAYFGLAGGSVFVYFAGRGLTTRRRLERHGARIGGPSNVRGAWIALPAWGAIGASTIALAIADLTPS